jgi:hypothetical protein
MMNKRASIALFAIQIACLLAAGAGMGQSVFGLNYLGEHVYDGGSRYRALAYSALAVPDTNGVLTQNPASRADLSAVTFSIVEVLDMSRIRTEYEIANQSRYNLPQIMIAVPLRKGLVFSSGYITGFMGRGDASYSAAVEEASSYKEIYAHRSSLFTVPLTISWKPLDWAGIAASFELERGSIRNDITIDFIQPGYDDSEFSRIRSFSGNSWSAAFLLRLHPRLYFAGLWNGEVRYEVEETMSYTRSEFDSAAVWDTTLPAAFGVGLSVGLSERWWLSSQYWRREEPDPTGFPQLAGNLGDESMVAVGLERRTSEEGGFLKRIPLRLGFYQNRWHFEIPGGEAVVSRFFTVGTSLSLPDERGGIDVSLELGQVGSVESNGVDERMARIGIGFNVSEPWSRRTEGSRY